MILFANAQPNDSSCALHTFAEVYSALTAMPVQPKFWPAQAELCVQEIRQRVTAISLNADEYLATIHRAAERGFSGGKIYDALLLACAVKSGAEVIYTWNLKHFRAIAPELADRIQTP